MEYITILLIVWGTLLFILYLKKRNRKRKNDTHELSFKIIYKNANEKCIKVFNINNGNLILFYYKYFEIRNLDTFKLIKKVEIVWGIQDVILISSNIFIICDIIYKIRILQLDKDYNINKLNSKIFISNLSEIKSSHFEYLNNKKIAFIVEISVNIFSPKKYEIYILKVDEINLEIYLVTKIISGSDIIYKFKNQNKYLLIFKRPYISIVNSINFKINKKFEIPYYTDIQINNDKFLIIDKDIKSLENFKKITSFEQTNNDIKKIFAFENNIFFSLELNLLFSTPFLRKWKFNEDKKKLVLLGNLDYTKAFSTIYNKNFFSSQITVEEILSMEKVHFSNDLYLIELFIKHKDQKKIHHLIIKI